MESGLAPTLRPHPKNLAVAILAPHGEASTPWSPELAPDISQRP